MDEAIKQAIEALGKTFEEFKAAHAAEIAEIRKNGVADPLTTQKVEKLSNQLTELQAAKDKAEAEAKARVDDLEKRLNRPPGGDGKGEAKLLDQFNVELKAEAMNARRPAPSVQGEQEMASYKAALLTYLRKGRDGLSGEEFKALSVGGDPQGGYMVMPDTSGRVVQRLRDYSPMRRLAFVQQIGTDALEGLIDRDEAGAGWVGEKQARPATSAPEVGKWRIPAEEMYAFPKATQKLLDDASIDIEAWLANKVADRFVRLEGEAFTTGNGVNKPRGFADYTTAATADASRSWGVLEHVATGANGGYHTTKADPLFDLIARFNPGYLENARWQTTRQVIATTRKLKVDTDTQYLWQPGLQLGQPAMLCGYPVEINEYLPALSANGASLWLGDWGEAYTIVDRIGMRVLVDPYTDKPYVGFYSTRRVGGAVTNFDAIKALKFATA